MALLIGCLVKLILLVRIQTGPRLQERKLQIGVLLEFLLVKMLVQQNMKRVNIEEIVTNFENFKQRETLPLQIIEEWGNLVLLLVVLKKVKPMEWLLLWLQELVTVYRMSILSLQEFRMFLILFNKV